MFCFGNVFSGIDVFDVCLYFVICLYGIGFIYFDVEFFGKFGVGFYFCCYYYEVGWIFVGIGNNFFNFFFFLILSVIFLRWRLRWFLSFFLIIFVIFLLKVFLRIFFVFFDECNVFVFFDEGFGYFNGYVIGFNNDDVFDGVFFKVFGYCNGIWW